MKRITIGFVLSAMLLGVSSCTQVASSSKETGIKDFPTAMVGTWIAQLGIGDAPDWQITFETDGTISQINHPVFGLMVIKDGGIYYDGPDPGTYMVATLGSVETNYDPESQTVEAKITIDDYAMKLPGGTLEGRMIDTFTGPSSSDGTTWIAERRNYGWLKGAKDPDIDFIDKNPEKKIFTKYPPQGEAAISSQTSGSKTEN